MTDMSKRNPEFAPLFETPYYAVIFASSRTPDDRGYEATANRMLELAAEQDGFLGVESTRGGDGFGITVSYWRTKGAIAIWRSQMEHVMAQEMGKQNWYEHYVTRVACVERDYEKS